MSSSYDPQESGSLAAAAAAVKFPDARYAGAGAYFAEYAKEMARASETIDPAAMERAGSLLVDAYARGARMFSCGNGGSAAIANHMQCDHLKGIRTGTDLAPQVLSLSTNVEVLTAIANDIGYHEVFVYQLQSQARPGDVLIAVSSSGRSRNIVDALTWARDNGLRTIAITGFEGGAARTVADVAIHVDCTNYGVVEDLHQAVMHALAQYVRQYTDGRGHDFGDGVLTYAGSDQPPDRRPGQPVGRPLVLDAGHPRDGQQAGDGRGTAPRREPAVQEDAPGLRATTSPTSPTRGPTSTGSCGRSASTCTRRCGCRWAGPTSSAR